MDTIKWILKDSSQLIHNINKNTKQDIPDNTRLFSVNVQNCYTEINEDGMIRVIQKILEKIENIPLRSGITMTIEQVIIALTLAMM